MQLSASYLQSAASNHIRPTLRYGLLSRSTACLVVQPTVILKSVGRQESLAAVRTSVRLLVGRRPGVDAVVVADAALGDELLAADGADERVKAGVTAQVRHQSALLLEQSTTLAAPVTANNVAVDNLQLSND